MADSKLLEALKQERASVIDAISKLQARLGALDSSIGNLEPFYSGPYPNLKYLADMHSTVVPVGITEAIRDVFQSAVPNSYLAPTEVRDRLKAAGLMKGYPNEMAVVHQVIRRLQDQGQIEAHPSDKVHRWIRPVRTISPKGLASLPQPKTAKPITAGETPFGKGTLARDSKK